MTVQKEREKMKKIYILALILLVTSCNNSQKLIDIYAMDNVNEFTRNKMLKGFYKHVDLATNLTYAEILVKSDLLAINDTEKQFEFCPVSSSYLYLHRMEKTRYDYKLYLNELTDRVNAQIVSKTSLNDFLSQRADSKIKHIDKIVSEIKVLPSYGAIGQIQYLVKKYKLSYDFDAFNVIENQNREDETDALYKRFETLNEVTNLVERLPLMNPLPSGKITNHFGPFMNPFTLNSNQNNGIIYRAVNKDVVFAAGKGVVIHADLYEDLGHSVVIDHGNDVKTIYSNLEFPMIVKKGDKVDILSPLAPVAKLSSATGNSFYYQIRLNDRPIDPRIFLSVGRKCNYGF